MMGGYGMMSGFGMFIPLLLIGFVVYAVFRLSNGNYSTKIKGNNALDILDERFANGEISEEEYIQKKKMLRE